VRPGRVAGGEHRTGVNQEEARNPGSTAPSRRVVLRASNVCKAFGATQALKGAGVEVEAGEIHALVGGNGSGKSTFLKILAGVHEADEGTVEIRGKQRDLRGFDADAARASGLHFVHQQPTTFGELSVAENLSLGRGFETDAIGRIRWRATKRHASAVLERFGIPVSPDERVGNLSPAYQTMVEIARALQDQEGQSGDVLALDEPTAALPPREVNKLLDTLRRHASEGQAILFVSHRLDEVLSIADRISVLRDGTHVATIDSKGSTKERLAELIVGHPMEAYYPDPVPASGEPGLLEVEGLSGGAVRDVSLSVAPGEILGIAGLVGSGRSSLLRLLFGAEPREGGVLRLRGRPYSPQKPADAIREGIVYVSDNRVRDSILPGLSLSENLSLVSIDDYWKGGWIRRGSERADSESTIRTFNIVASSAKAPITTLSGGNQQKVALARWLSRQPQVLLLDEPTQGVDVGARAELWRLMQDAAKRRTAVVMVSSDFEELAHLCGRLIVLRNGRSVAELSASGLEPDEINRILHEMQASP
jgi:ribose transport system ATP-binding protein